MTIPASGVYCADLSGPPSQLIHVRASERWDWTCSSCAPSGEAYVELVNARAWQVNGSFLTRIGIWVLLPPRVMVGMEQTEFGDGTGDHQTRGGQ